MRLSYTQGNGTAAVHHTTLYVLAKDHPGLMEIKSTKDCRRKRHSHPRKRPSTNPSRFKNESSLGYPGGPAKIRLTDDVLVVGFVEGAGLDGSRR